MKIVLDVWDDRAAAIAFQAMQDIFALYQPPSVGEQQEVRAQPIEEVLAELAEEEAAPTPTPAVSIDPTDARAAIQAAANRGVTMPTIVGILTEFGVRRVTELTGDQVTEFIAKLAAVK